MLSWRHEGRPEGRGAYQARFRSDFEWTWGRVWGVFGAHFGDLKDNVGSILSNTFEDRLDGAFY